VEYKKTFIRQVIARIDFAAPLDKLEKEFPKGFDKLAQKKFPIKVPVQMVLPLPMIAGANIVADMTKKYPMWEYQDRKRENKLELLPTHMDVVFTKYTNYYEDLKNTFVELSDALTKEITEITIRRFGLRFINNIDVEDKSAPTKWEKYLNKDLLSVFKMSQKSEDVLRAFSILTYRSDDVLLNFRYGMLNPDYPAPIKKKEFILDYDAFYEGLLEGKDIPAYLDLFHRKIYELFETCITKETRKIMGPIDGRKKKR
jgi:uncharacterized protein (TIGR04255 family)